jgi:hypothetical protein
MVRWNKYPHVEQLNYFGISCGQLKTVFVPVVALIFAQTTASKLVRQNLRWD